MARPKMNQSQFDTPSSFDGSEAVSPEPPAQDFSPDGMYEIDVAPKDGTNIVVMEFFDSKGVMAYWRNTRIRRMGKWAPQGSWRATLTHQPVGFEPKYWKEQETVKWEIDPSIADKQRIIELERKLKEVSQRR